MNRKLEHGDTLVMHPADFAALIGVRRTRAGRWVWQGRTYRTRALALRRAPRCVRIAGVDTFTSADVPRGTAWAMKPYRFSPFSWEPELLWEPARSWGWGFGL